MGTIEHSPLFIVTTMGSCISNSHLHPDPLSTRMQTKRKATRELFEKSSRGSVWRLQFFLRTGQQLRPSPPRQKRTQCHVVPKKQRFTSAHSGRPSTCTGTRHHTLVLTTANGFSFQKKDTPPQRTSNSVSYRLHSL